MTGRYVNSKAQTYSSVFAFYRVSQIGVEAMARQIRPSAYVAVSQLKELKQLEERDGKWAWCKRVAFVANRVLSGLMVVPYFSLRYPFLTLPDMLIIGSGVTLSALNKWLEAGFADRSVDVVRHRAHQFLYVLLLLATLTLALLSPCLGLCAQGHC